MNPFEMVVIIIAITMTAGVLKAKYGRHRDAEDDEQVGASPDSNRLREEVRALKERIAVLERIATDKESSLDREIDRLRDR